MLQFLSVSRDFKLRNQAILCEVQCQDYSLALFSQGRCGSCLIIGRKGFATVAFSFQNNHSEQIYCFS